MGRSLDEIMDSVNVESTALAFAQDQGIEGMALNGPSQAFIENMFRSKVLAMRPEVNAALTNARATPVANLGGDVVTGMSERGADAVNARVFGNAAGAMTDAVSAGTAMQNEAAGAMMNVYSQIDSMALNAKLAREQIEAMKPTGLDRALQVASIGASLIGPL